MTSAEKKKKFLDGAQIAGGSVEVSDSCIWNCMDSV